MESSRAAYDALLQTCPELTSPTAKENWQVLEIGCGTGLLSLLVAPHVKELVGVDTSQGMIDMLDSKSRKQGLESKVKAIKVLLQDADDPVLEGKKFDLVLSHLVFHHIPRMQETIHVMAQALKPGAQSKMIISDFEDNGEHALRFHPKDKHAGVERHGLLASELDQLLQEEAKVSGLKDVKVIRPFSLGKSTEQEDGSTKKEPYPFLFCMATKA